MKRKWELIPGERDTVDELTRHIGCHPVTAKLLNNRSIYTAEDAHRFFNPVFQHLTPPFRLKHIDRAATRIVKGLKKKEKMLIFGDYDVDGITATFIVLRFLRLLGAEVDYYIPHRVNEGYGLKPGHITSRAVPEHVTLIITVDCGIMSHDAVTEAGKHGIDIIITDHHEPSETLPRAFAVINPKRKDDPSSLQNLAGVGVAFCLIVCLRKHLREIGHWDNRPEPNLKSFLDLVALGTIADMVPLLGDNRILTRAGVDMLRSGENAGLRALMKLCRIDRRHVNAGEVMFQMAPRLNAAGRIERADAAISLLSAENSGQADVLAEHLDDLNKKRRELERTTLMEIERTIERKPQHAKGSAIVLFSPDWHVGILGIVASRLVNRFARPVIILAADGKTAKGSARSVPGIDLSRVLTACSHNLISFGGHAMAAGLQLKIENIDRFREDIEQSVTRAADALSFRPELRIDCELPFEDISPALLDEIQQLQPFGEQNREPLFIACDVRVQSSKILSGGHRRMSLGQANGRGGQSLPAIHFNPDPESVKEKIFRKIAYRLQWNRWNGRKSLQLVVEDVKV